MGTPIAAGLWQDEPPALIGGRDRATGRIVFPCPADERFEPMPLPRRGTIWSWTVQRFPPKSPPYAGPEPFEPFALGYVELPGTVIVEARFHGIGFDELRTGLAVELVIVPLTDGTDIFAFTKAGDAA
jgi:uncharacterized OB-fold protein